MSYSTNKEWIDANNDKIDEIKTLADDLPDYQDVEPIYTTLSYTPKWATNVSNSNSLEQTNYTPIVYKEFVVIYKSYTSSSPHPCYIYYKGEYITSFDITSQYISSTNVYLKRGIFILGSNDNYLYIGIPQGTTSYSTNVSVQKVDYINKSSQRINDITLSSSIYYMDNQSNSNRGESQYFYDSYLVIQNAPYRNWNYCWQI